MRPHAWQVRHWGAEDVLRCEACGVHGPIDDVDWKTRMDDEGCRTDQPSPALQGETDE